MITFNPGKRLNLPETIPLLEKASKKPLVLLNYYLS